MPLLDTFNIQEVTGGIKIWKDEKEKKTQLALVVCGTSVVSPFARLFRVSTRSYVAITFTSPGHCVATMTQPLHSHSASRRDFFETFWGSDSSVGSLFSRLLPLFIHNTKFFTQNLSPTRFPGLNFLPCSHACPKVDEVSRALGRPVCFRLSVPSL